MRPRLKRAGWTRDDDTLRVVVDRRDHLEIPDADGAVERLLHLLRAGGRSVAELAEALDDPSRPVTSGDVLAGLDVLDGAGLVEDGDHLGGLASDQRTRHISNLAFFEPFASLETSSEDFQRRLLDSHVLVLGAGGLGGNAVQNLAGLGVGRLTLLDRDVVEPGNFARQFVYRWADIGHSKVERAAEWVRAFDPAIDVRAISGEIDSAETLARLLDELNPDLVVSGIDKPRLIDQWVNAACVGHGVPFIRGGMFVTEGLVFSVAPGRSGCLDCVAPDDSMGDPVLARELDNVRIYAEEVQINRGIGPVATLLGSLVAFEALRYLTRFEPPVYAANMMWIDFAAGCALRQEPWERNVDCAVCSDRVSSAPEAVRDEDRDPARRERQVNPVLP